MNDLRRAMFKRAAKVWRRRRVIHDQRQLGLVRDFPNFIEISDVTARVSDAFAEDRFFDL